MTNLIVVVGHEGEEAIQRPIGGMQEEHLVGVEALEPSALGAAGAGGGGKGGIQ